MIARIRRSLARRDEGFTLIELLVVMIIIGILAAIAIPIFLNQRKKAEDAAAKADVSTIGKEIATFYVDGTGAVTITGGDKVNYTLTPATGTAYNIGNSSKNVIIAAQKNLSQTNWCVRVTNAEGDQTKAPNAASYSSANGLRTGTAAETCV